MLSDYESQIKRLPHGDLRLEMHRAAVKEADEDGDFIYRFFRRYEYIKESIFHGDAMEAFVEFPKLMQIHDEGEQQGLTDRDFNELLMWAFKYMLDSCFKYYQITTQQFEDYLAEYKRRCIRYGFTLRTYYRIKMQYYRHVDPEVEAEAFKMFPRQHRDGISDCIACDLNSEVEYLLVHGHREEALKKGEKLFNRTLYCGEVPEITYELLTLDTCARMARGEKEHTEEDDHMCLIYANGLRYGNKAPEGFGVPMLYYAMTGNNKALTWFQRYSTLYETMRCPVYKFYFAMGAVRFFAARKKETYKMKLTPEFPFYNQENVYNVKQLKEYYYNYALDVATKLDARNGNNSYREELDLYCGEI